MPHFWFANHGGKQPDTPEETEVEIQRWRGLRNRISPAIVDPAIGLAKACPIIGDGSIEVAKIHEVSMQVSSKEAGLAGFHLADKNSMRNNN